MKTHQKGRSMVEMLGVLAIIAVLSAGGLAGYSKAMYKIKMNKTIEQISTIAVNVQMLAANDSQHSMTDQWLHENALTAGFVPQEMIKDGKIWTSLKNEIWICGSYGGESRLQITITKITSPHICSDLSSIDWSNIAVGAVGVLPDGENIQTWVGNDWKLDGLIESSEGCFIASKYGRTLNFPVPASVFAPICAQCSAENPCIFDMEFEL